MKEIRRWEDLLGLENDTHIIELNKLGEDYVSGWASSKKDIHNNKLSEKSIYLSTHTFYKEMHEKYTERLQNIGFNVKIIPWEEE